MANWFVNEGPKYLFMLIWLGINIVLFVITYLKYDTNKEYVYLKQILKAGLPMARGAAMVLNFNCMLILFPVCRNLISLVRGTCRCLPNNILRLLDKNITFHKVCAYMICLATAIHVGSHLFNVENFVTSWESTDAKISRLNNIAGDNYVNPIREANSDPVTEAVRTVAGVSGVVITMCLIIMVTSSTELIRRSYFEVFWFTHHLFVIFFIGLIVHGMQGLIHAQQNPIQHDPEVCKNKLPWNVDPKCIIPPTFGAPGPATWKWVIVPMCIYFIERCIRFYRYCQKTTISKVVKHPSKVLEIQMKKDGFHADPGQYVFLHCPTISKLEWHPFTLTSCPEEDFFSLHIRLVGDWTGELAKVCDVSDINQIPRVAVDGPFGTASTDVFNYSVCVCVGAGIGVTPFASILKSIWYQHQQSKAEFKITKVYFFWICPDTNAFEWFTDLLQSLEQQMEENGMQDFLEYNIYLTRGWDQNQARNIALHEGSDQDVITGLKQKMNFGRPNWDQIFKGVADKHTKTDIGVFFCGPAILSHTLHKMSNLHSNDKTGAKFYYNKENF